MIARQQHESVNRKRMSRFNGPERGAQQFDVIRFAKKFPPSKSHNSEKTSTAGSFSAPILHDEDPQLPDILAPEDGTAAVKAEIRHRMKLGSVGHKQHTRPTGLLWFAQILKSKACLTVLAVSSILSAPRKASLT